MFIQFVNAGSFDEAERLYEATPLECRDPFCLKLEEVVQVFEGMVETNVVSCSSMVDGYCKKYQPNEA